MSFRQVVLVAFTCLIGFAAHADIKYSQITPIAENGLSFRDSWDQLKRFCYIPMQSKTVQCMPITGLVELKLRENGQWTTDSSLVGYVQALGPDLQAAIAAKYDKVFVRYIATQIRSNSTNDYIVHIFFLNKGDSDSASQTIFEMGSFTADANGVSVQPLSMSYSNTFEIFGASEGAAQELGVSIGTASAQNAILNQIVRANQLLLDVGQVTVQKYIELNAKTELILVPKP